MKKGVVSALLMMVTISIVCLAGGSKGTVPRSQASRYPVHQLGDRLSIGAARLTADQVKKEFVSDISRCCVVVEVALYPSSGGELDVEVDDFVLREAGTDAAVRPSKPALLAGIIQKTTPSKRDVTLYPSVGIGYESGPRVYDPVSGDTRGGGVRTSAGVGVGIGESRPGSTDRDRDVMELELSEKALPEGKTAAPVSGYLYFQIPTRKKAGAPVYELEYTRDTGKLKLSLR